MSKVIKRGGQPTGYRHARCYANSDADCSTKISKEHFFSASLQRRLQLNKKVKIAGLAWQKKEQFDLIPVNRLGSNILCERHNSAMSGLDTSIVKFARTIHDFDQAPKNQSAPFCGSDIERWMLKCLIGLVASNNINSKLKPECVDILFGRAAWPDGWGLYFFSPSSRPIYHTDSFLLKTRVSPDGQLILAADFFIQGLPFILIMGKPGDPAEFGVWRPREVRFQRPSFVQTMSLTWDDKCSDQFVSLTRTGTYDGHPPNWRGWERSG